ncbi:hypothetical protein DF223_04945 [Mycetocola zhujimingii]|uniref:Uncharacterized protein n=1 Tax=Mycetocola zhujimingii TaxID=2079792 RepID=A0A2U1TFH6_9MICO|nr:hypothetical protein DF223_04945 [Mycetocola zhujimingii]
MRWTGTDVFAQNPHTVPDAAARATRTAHQPARARAAARAATARRPARRPRDARASLPVQSIPRN